MESNLCFSQNLGFRTVEHLDSTLRPLLYTKRRHFNRVLVLASSAQTVGGVSVNPVYKPTPRNRELRTPHSGYHFDGSTRRFFEGWYFRVSIPERKQSFCIIYSVENPAFKKKLSSLEVAQHGPRFTGVGVQILGADDKYMCHYSEESSNFWGSRHELMLGNTFRADKGSQPPTKEEFNRRVLEGFQVTPLWHQGCIHDDGRTNFAETVKSARWEYSTRPVYGWGWIEWDGERFEFQDAPSYSEKNWGGAFPRKWFWVQCNVFEGATGEVALTAGGGLRQLPVLDSFENAAMIGIHYDGILYEFVPWNGVVSWEISQWGYWYFAAENQTHMVELKATTKYPGTTLRAPTSEAGLAPACKDTCFGELTLQLWERRYDGTKGKMILDVTSDMAALEVGGGPWFNTWKAKTATPELLRRTLNVPVDVDGLFGFVPFFKPPGL
ncbi:Tocopherol cyclase [Citrus sinensis]|uniref:Tocopherol cyclase n=1 Tax=Citrus sinensis TaxID=2711 RepID=A0ACB8NN00_CITSI|nr:Tocopherol cyclase [Citrus sinensis]